MSGLQYYAYPGVGERNRETYGYQQAVRIGDRIECSGQGGWDPKTGEINTEINAQIEQAFANVDLCLKDAGGKGWEQVFRVNSYHVPHKPIWTTVGVQRLGEDDMRVEIEVSAYDPK